MITMTLTSSLVTSGHLDESTQGEGRDTQPRHPKNFEKFKFKILKYLFKRTYKYCCLLNEVEAKYKRLKEELNEHSKERNRFEQQKVPLLRS